MKSGGGIKDKYFRWTNYAEAHFYNGVREDGGYRALIHMYLRTGAKKTYKRYYGTVYYSSREVAVEDLNDLGFEQTAQRKGLSAGGEYTICYYKRDKGSAGAD